MQAKLPYKALVFDWDGTLMNSALKIVNCLKASIELCGLEPCDDADLSYVIGLGLHEALNHLYPELDFEHFDQFRQHYREQFLYKDQTQEALYEGVTSMLEALEQKGYFLAIATGKGRQGLQKVLQDTQVAHRFMVSRCADESASKPNPMMLEQIIDYLGIDLEQALMIGDTEFDMQMAVNANVDRVAVKQGAHTVEQLAKHEPLAILEHITQLDAWLDGI